MKASLGMSHLLVPVTPWLSGDPEALSQLGWQGHAPPYWGVSLAMPHPWTLVYGKGVFTRCLSTMAPAACLPAWPQAGFVLAGTWASSEPLGEEGSPMLGTGLSRSRSWASRQGPIVPCRGCRLAHQ